jgi:hypothetical protein
LNDILTPDFRPKGQWRVYKSYADITGTLLEVRASENIDGVAGINESEETARILLGNNFYRKGSQAGSAAIGNIEISLAGLDKAQYLYPKGRIKVEVFEIPETNSALPDGPVKKLELNIPVTGGAANFTIPWATWEEAYEVIITPYR